MATETLDQEVKCSACFAPTLTVVGGVPVCEEHAGSVSAPAKPKAAAKPKQAAKTK
jgi:hypothetical protein